ncbi:hypothetical protein CMQ_7024 [Grosmannia clavigera kw1407]|uniref:Protamine p1 n=1 Tax=Grosmannia clavigera (strain kw1407 / UAMH 11150) TaxID=655863 RepID=F0X6Z7_GROCL|nr:uncharacterized protein CMQ_7024 [Grosmannia clavigera kw1407]EFX06703.1 hypothetical protein CMQ_7024 [Grosmannia clavigera kw1407]
MTSGRRRLGREAMFELPSFGNEPIFFEPTHCPDDILYSGSEDEYYDSPSARSRSCEDQARLFLEGRRPFLLSASLKGPFDGAKGWNNPWRGKGGGVAIPQARRLRGPESSPPAIDIAVVPSVDSAPHSEVATWRVDARTPFESENKLWRSPTTEMDATDQVTNRSWLRRRNLKRANPIDDDEFAVSPTATVHRNKSRKLAGAAQCASLLLEAARGQGCAEGDILGKESPPELQEPAYETYSRAPSPDLEASRTTLKPNGNLEDQRNTSPYCQKGNKSNIVKNDRASSITFQESELALRFYTDDDAVSPRSPALATANQPEYVTSNPWSSNNSASDSLAEKGALEENTIMHDTLNMTGTAISQPGFSAASPGGLEALSSDQRNTSYCDTLIRNPFSDRLGRLNDVVDQLSDVSGGSVEKLNETDLPMEEKNGHGSRDVLDEAGNVEAEKSWLDTQDQSPWAKDPSVMPSTPRKPTAEVNAEDLEGVPDLRGVGTEPDRLRVNETITKTAVPIQTQSPWLKEISLEPSLLDLNQLVPSAIKDEEKLLPTDTTNKDMAVTLDQNPWVDEISHTEESLPSSLPQLPTSPNSPSSPGFVSQTAWEQQQVKGIPGPSAAPPLPSSVITPSTPEMKRSNLPSPDLTVSIKSFRKFRSLTPTPPQRRTTQPGGLRSVLLPPRSKRDARSGKHDRRVCFVFPEQEDNSGFPFTYLYDVEDKEEGQDDKAPTGGHTPLQSAHGVRGGGVPSSLQSRSQRATSPPPRQSVMAEALPSEVEKFQGHFASVASRCHPGPAGENPVGWATVNGARRSHFRQTGLNELETVVVDVFGSSPLFGNMTETSKTCKASQGDPAVCRSANCTKHGGYDRDKENMWDQPTDSKERSAGCDDHAVDDVQEVLENLGDFLGMWDVDTELSKATTGEL